MIEFELKTASERAIIRMERTIASLELRLADVEALARRLQDRIDFLEKPAGDGDGV